MYCIQSNLLNYKWVGEAYTLLAILMLTVPGGAAVRCPPVETDCSNRSLNAKV